ncbi:NAD(P)-binding domain-containing protein, partial [Sinomonas terrae]
MHFGLIGLGKMGFNMRERARRAGLEVTGYDRNPDVADVASIAELVDALPAPRVIWVMVPAGAITDAVVKELCEKLSAGDLVIDGGNSRFTEDQRHAAELAEKGIRFVDCGVSGGVWGLQNGYGLMAGGEAEDIETAMPIFDALRPEGERADSFVHVGGVGAGHYAKMVHNGIEYGLMQSYAEGYQL